MNAINLAASARQTQTASPRLQQAVRLLQMSSQEFSAVIRHSLHSNPFLEADEDDPGCERLKEHEQPALATDDAAIDAGWTGAPLSHEEGALWLSGPISASANNASVGSETPIWERIPAHTSLFEHLCLQLNMMPLSARDLALACAMADALDDDGYLRTPPHEAFEGWQIEPEPDDDDVRIALCRVQALDPPGIGARNVQECLLLQVPTITNLETRALAKTLICEHMTALVARDVQRLARVLRVSAQQVETACDAIRRLDPRPGARFGNAHVDYVVPDVIARKQAGKWGVILNSAVVPAVRINEMYAGLFQRHRGTEHHELARHLQEARWTLQYVQQRYTTILDVAQAIIKRQQHFFDLGPMAMKPLALRDIAEELGIHESTVSRVTNNKYMDTPAGVIELKRFFSRSIVSANGQACSGTAIRGLIAELVQAESPQAPLSDVALCRLLSEQGLDVARRTVTKYRQLLRIEAVEKRRRVSPATHD